MKMNSKIEKIKTAAEQTQAQLTGPLGVGFYDLKSGASYYHNGSKPFPTASIFKIFVLAELFRRVHEGELSLEDRIPLEDRFKAPGSGVLFQMRSGTAYTLYDYAFLMNTLSDNTAADFLFHKMGRDNIKKNVLDPLGLTQTKVDLSCSDLFTDYCGLDPNTSPEERIQKYLTGDFFHADYYKCTQERNDVTTPEDLSVFYETMYNGKWCNEETSQAVLGLMKKCQTNSRIPRLLPPGTPVAHKTGSFDRLANDSGIVYAPCGDYILTMLYNGNMADEEEYYKKNLRGAFGEGLMAELSRKVYDIYTE